MQFEVTTRKQYTFNATDKTLALLFNEIIRPNTTQVNIVGLFITKVNNKKCNLVKIIVGTTDPNNPSRGGAGYPLSPDPTRSNKLQNKRFVEVLKEMKIKFSKQTVVQIVDQNVNAGVPGIYRIAYTTLYCNDIKIIASYGGENAFKFPLVICQCNDGSTTLEKGSISLFFEVREKDIENAVNALRKIQLTTPFDESQLCINRNNIESKIKGFRAKKCDLCDSESNSD